MKHSLKVKPVYVSQRELESVFLKVISRSKLLQVAAILSEVLLLKHVIKCFTTRHHPAIRRLHPRKLPAAGAKLQAPCLGIQASQVSWKPAPRSLELVTIL